MAFDMGFDFRGTAGFVTDPSYGVPVLAEAYPHTYTAANGNSINAGWDGGVVNQDLTNTNDARIAGDNFNGGFTNTFKIDLSSGSTPGAGSYGIDLAVGHAVSPIAAQNFKVRDTSTLLIDGTNGGTGYATAPGHFIDATLADVAASTSWTGATSPQSFATTLVNFDLNPLIMATNTTFAHFRLTLQTPTPSGGVTGMPWWLLGPTILPGSDLMRSF